jgi:hypothetical protein
MFKGNRTKIKYNKIYRNQCERRLFEICFQYSVQQTDATVFNPTIARSKTKIICQLSDVPATCAGLCRAIIRKVSKRRKKKTWQIPLKTFICGICNTVTCTQVFQRGTSIYRQHKKNSPRMKITYTNTYLTVTTMGIHKRYKSFIWKAFVISLHFKDLYPF